MQRDARAGAPVHDAADAGETGRVMRRARGDACVVLMIGAAGLIALALAVHTGIATMATFAIVYLASLLALIALLRSARRAGRDTSAATLGVIAAAVIGPPGAIGAAAVAFADRADPSGNALLDAWYERIALAIEVDRVTQLCDDVGVGRTMNLGDDAPQSFLAVMETGSLAEKQAVLGLVARRFHPDYLAVLKSALRSPEAVVRVQAAAVAAHVRPAIAARFQDCLRELADATASPGTALALLRRVDQLRSSGLLDAADERRAQDIAGRLGDVALARVPGVPGAGERGLARADRATVESLLLARRRFADLRKMRSTARALAARPRARVRRLAGERVLRGAAR